MTVDEFTKWMGDNKESLHPDKMMMLEEILREQRRFAQIPFMRLNFLGFSIYGTDLKVVSINFDEKTIFVARDDQIKHE